MGNCYSVSLRKTFSFSLPLPLSLSSASASASQAGSGSGSGVGLSTDRDGDGDGDGLMLRLSSSSSGRASSSSFPLILRTKNQDDGDILFPSNLHNFSFPHLKAATRNFRPDSVLGEGGFGSVFKGWIHDTTLAPAKPGLGIAIAVKRLNNRHATLQGHKEWLAEVHYLGRLSHPNLVRLLGYCFQDEQRLLVYEFMPRGSLDNHLFRRGSYFQPLSWKLRMKVALGAAQGLAYLHSAQAKVIYRDFKTSNVLLDSNYNAKLSDFGLAKDGPTGEKTHVSTRVMGTHGYAAPEYLATGHLTTKSDVYSFGVVLLEMLSGRRAIDKNQPQGEHNLVEWARPYLRHKRKIFRVLDRRLEGQCSPEGAHTVASLASQCLMMDTKLRPRMKDVVAVLEQLQVKDTEEKNRQKLESIENKEGLKNKVDCDKLLSRGGSLKESSDVKVPVCS